MYIQDSVIVCFHFMEFGEKFTIAIAHYSILLKTFLYIWGFNPELCVPENSWNGTVLWPHGLICIFSCWD